MSLTLKDFRSLEHMLDKLQDDVTIVYFTEEVNCRHCRQERELLAEMADLSPKLHLEIHNFGADRAAAKRYGVDKVPGFVLVGRKDCGVRYYGMPSDFEFRMLLEDMGRISAGQSGLQPEIADRIKRLSVPLHLEVVTTPTCSFSETAVRLAHQMAMESDLITADLVNVDDFPEIARRYKVAAAPTVVVNESHQFYGGLEASEFVREVLEGAEKQPSRRS